MFNGDSDDIINISTILLQLTKKKR